MFARTILFVLALLLLIYFFGAHVREAGGGSFYG
jgi:hypothetical protein